MVLGERGGLDLLQGALKGSVRCGARIMSSQLKIDASTGINTIEGVQAGSLAAALAQKREKQV